MLPMLCARSRRPVVQGLCAGCAWREKSSAWHDGGGYYVAYAAVVALIASRVEVVILHIYHIVAAHQVFSYSLQRR